MAKKQGKKDAPEAPQVKNKKAYLNYELVEKVEAGVVLLGTEVKSLRNRGGDLDGAYARISGGELWLVGCKIAPYAMASVNHDPERKRKLLLRKSQIHKIEAKLMQRGFTLVPLRIYFNNRGLAKVEVALVRGKRQYDKRSKLQKEQQRLDLQRDLKRYRKERGTR
ncbi:MAG: SsrA-binding protein SmpB [Sedimentisphaerales bacterium]|nr:SsrA-binding protein SmpB [Sedimentisphaerales bacterium]